MSFGYLKVLDNGTVLVIPENQSHNQQVAKPGQHAVNEDS